MGPNPGLVSGEGVRLELLPAGVGSRVIASLIDVAIQGAAYLVLVLVDVAIAGSADEAAIRAVLVVELVLVLAGYPIVFEWATRGRTVGKICLGLRVVRDDGGPIGFRQAAVRGLASLTLEKPGLVFPFTTLAGLLTISSSSREKRIGDMMAGTVVLNERSAPQVLASAPGVGAGAVAAVGAVAGHDAPGRPARAGRAPVREPGLRDVAGRAGAVGVRAALARAGRDLAPAAGRGAGAGAAGERAHRTAPPGGRGPGPRRPGTAPGVPGDRPGVGGPGPSPWSRPATDPRDVVESRRRAPQLPFARPH